MGLGVTAFRIWNGAWSLWHDYVSAIVLEGSDGIRYLEYASTDMLGNAEEVRNATLIVDDTPPAIGIQPEASRVSEDVSFLLTADDGQGCGVARLEYSIDEGEWMQYSMPFILELGQHIIKYRSWDNLNNSAERVHSVNVVTADLPPDTDVAVNYKPVIAFLFSILLAVAGEISAKRKPLRWPKSRMTFLSSWSVISLPFVVAEAATGLLSLFIESLRVPPILGLGMGVDCAILAFGIAFMLVRLRMPPSDECGESSPDQA